MQRLPIKSKNGCLTCRRRRKKCDESDPRCGPCQRLDLECVWTAKEDHGAERYAGMSVSRVVTQTKFDGRIQLAPSLIRRATLTPHVTGGGYKAFNDQLQFDLVVQTPKHLGILISKTAAKEFHNTTILITLALQNPWLRDALAAFSAFNVAASAEQNEVELMGTKMYQLALRSVREYISKSTLSMETIEVLTAITFLGLFESLGTGDAEPAIKHFATAAKLSQTIPVPACGMPLTLYRIAVECWLFNLAGLAIYHPFPRHVTDSLDWSILDRAFSTPMDSCQLALDTSPFVGGGHVIYKLMLQVTCYARDNFPLEERLRQTTRWSMELDHISTNFLAYYDFLPHDVASLYYFKYVLHIHAIRIFLIKIVDREASSSSPAIRQVVDEACRVFQERPVSETRNPSLAWPLVIFFCASYRSSNLDFLISNMESIRDNFDPGHARRLAQVLNFLKRDKQRGGGLGAEQHAPSHDTLDLLLSEDGILG